MTRNRTRRVFIGARIAVLAAAASAVAGCGSSGSGTSQTSATTSEAAAAHSVQPARKHQPAKDVAVPKLVGQRFGRSVRELNRHGLRQTSAGFPGSASSTAMNGCTRIISQAPAPGTKVPEHSTIHVTIGMTSIGRASC